jgi:hypothetical protein
MKNTDFMVENCSWAGAAGEQPGQGQTIGTCIVACLGACVGLEWLGTLVGLVYCVYG